MSAPSEADRAAKRNDYLKFVARIYAMRSLGLGTGCIAVGGVLYEDQAAWPWWVVLVFNACVWPTLAYWLARRSRHPQHAERWNLAVDSAAGGMWIAVMLPSLLLAVMLSADKVGVGGWPFLLRTAAAQLAACLVTWALIGFPFQPETTMHVILWSVPFMLAYPLALSTAAYALGRKVVRQNRILDRLSRMDVLTGLPNRRQWDEAAATEFARSARSGRHAALLMLDVDHFKEINDHYGHPVGDRVLKELALILQSIVRETDTPGRFGGDEFGLVLIETSYSDAVEVAERIRSAVQAMRFEDLPDLRCAVSIGISVADPSLESLAEWIRHADIALYRAKRAGRNQIVLHNRDTASEAAAMTPLADG